MTEIGVDLREATEATLIFRYSDDHFQCSLCDGHDGIFTVTSTPDRLVEDFRKHVEEFHPEAMPKRKPREDVNRAAARIVREATRD